MAGSKFMEKAQDSFLDETFVGASKIDFLKQMMMLKYDMTY